MVATTRLGLNAQTPGTNANTWGGTLNDQVIALVDEAVAGVETIPVAGNMTLTSTNFVSNQARNLGLLFTPGGASATATITIPGREKVYIVFNTTGQTLNLSAGGAVGSLVTGRWAIMLCNGTDVFALDPTAQAAQLLADTIAARNTAVTASGSASGSAQTASDQAALAVAAYDAFDDRYLGSKASDPTLDNDDNALLIGALYWNTTANQMRVYTGSNWAVLAVMAIASQAQAQAGTDNATAMTPLRTAQAIAALAPAPPVPGLVFISQQTISSAVASVSVTGLSSAYDEYLLEVINLVPSVAAYLYMRSSTNGGSTYDAGATDYAYSGVYLSSNAPSAATSAGAAQIALTSAATSVLTTANLGGVSSSIKLIRPSASDQYTSFETSTNYMASATAPIRVLLNGVRLAATDVDAVQVFFNSGNVVSGLVKLYGLRKS